MIRDTFKAKGEPLFHRNPPTMSKAEEKRLYREFILATPECSYLRTVLEQSRDFVFGNIDNDISWPVSEHVREMSRWVIAENDRRKQLTRDIRELEERKRKLENEVKYLESDRRMLLKKTKAFLDSVGEETVAISRRIRETAND